MKKLALILMLLGICSTASAQVINEVYYDAPGSDVGTFTEIFGTPGMSLDGFTLDGINGSNGTMYRSIDLTGQVIPADGYFVIAQDMMVANADMIDSGADWQNGPDQVQLLNMGVLVDSVCYGTSANLVCEGTSAQDVSGTSIGRDAASTDTDDNSVDFSEFTTPTPGEANIAAASCGAPNSLSCVSDCMTGDITLTWVNGDLYDTIDILRDGVVIASGLANSTMDYTDPALATAMYSYEIRGNCPNALSGSDTCVVDHCPPMCANPSALSCVSDCGTGDVTLSWTNNDTYASGIEILRNGVSIASIAGTETSYVDLAAPAAAYEYEVVASCSAGLSGSTSCDLFHCLTLPDVVINEIRIDMSGADDEEFFEIAGDPGTSLDGLSYIVLGDDGAGSSGVIENVTHLSGNVIPASGYFVVAKSTFTIGTADLTASLQFENSDNTTHILAFEFSGSNGDDLDADDDGVLDVTPWTSTADVIALIEENNPPMNTEFHYGPPSVGPDGTFAPAYVQRCPDRTGSFTVGEFDVTMGEDTPGVTNNCPVCIAPEALACVSDCMSGDIVLSWTLPVTAYDTIEILRDGVSIAMLGAMDVTYTDTAVASGTYNYEVIGTCAGTPVSSLCNVPHCLPAPSVVINEIRIDQSGTDNDEFAELFAAPGTSLDGVTYLVLGDGAGGSGSIEFSADLTGSTVGASGYFVIAKDTFTLGTPDLQLPLQFENGDNVTHFLVFNFTGATGDDLDVDDDGVLDSMPWSDELDRIAIIETANPPAGAGDEWGYGPPFVGPDGMFVPGHTMRCPDGTGTFIIADFDPLVEDTPGATNTCPTCFEVSDLICTSDCTTGDVTLNWTNSAITPYTQITITRDGIAIAAGLSGMDTSYVDAGQAAGTYIYEVIAECAPMDVAVASCAVANAPYSGELNIIFAGEESDGAIDSAASLRAALIANGETALIIDQLATYPCLGDLTGIERVFAMLGTFPAEYALTADDGDTLVTFLQSGVSVYVEGADAFVFDPATSFADYDGVDNSIRDAGNTMAPFEGDDSLTELSASSAPALDLSAFTTAAYNQDNVIFSDFTDILLVTGTDPMTPEDLPMGTATVVWNNSPDLLPDPMVVEDAYAVGIMYETDAMGDTLGNVLVQSWEFGGFGGDQLTLAANYVAALTAGLPPVGDEFRRGDCNNDSGINIADAIHGLGFLFPGGGTPSVLDCVDACDANDDGAINIADIIALLGSQFGSPTVPLASPYPNCGLDTTGTSDCAGYNHCP